MNTSLQSIKINLFGVGCSVIIGQFEESIWLKFQKVAKVMRCSLEEAVFDDSFYKQLGLKDYQSFVDLGNEQAYKGLINDNKSLIEIRINNRQKRKILFKELLNETVLFPVFQTTISRIENLTLIPNSLLAIEKEIGTFASYKFEAESFSLDKLSFVITILSIQKPSDLVLLTKITYDGHELMTNQSDTVVTERYCLFN